MARRAFDLLGDLVIEIIMKTNDLTLAYYRDSAWVGALASVCFSGLRFCHVICRLACVNLTTLAARSR